MREIAGFHKAEAEMMGAHEGTRTWGVKHDDATFPRSQKIHRLSKRQRKSRIGIKEGKRQMLPQQAAADTHQRRFRLADQIHTRLVIFIYADT